MLRVWRMPPMPGWVCSGVRRWWRGAGYLTVTLAVSGREAEEDPAETVNVGILIPERSFQHWADGGWTLEAGAFTLAAGSSSASLPLTASVTVK